MKVLSVVGARPQFIKVMMVSRAIRAHHHEVLVHTGQHYDFELSKIFFDELRIPDPDYNLEVGVSASGLACAEMMAKLERVIAQENPKLILVYGDTDSTLAGALTAAKMGIASGHIEAGLRSYNKKMQEEINRVLSDHVAELLFCPTATAVNNLKKEGITSGVHLTGDVTYDAVLEYLPAARKRAHRLGEYGLKPKEYLLVTIHRAENVDSQDRLSRIIEAIGHSAHDMVFPVHPRTMKNLSRFNLLARLEQIPRLRLINPISYLSMLALEENASAIITDSGGVQKEAYFLEVPCLTFRPETEWVETLEGGWNQLVALEPDSLMTALSRLPIAKPNHQYFGSGKAYLNIGEAISQWARE